MSVKVSQIYRVEGIVDHGEFAVMVTAANRLAIRRNETRILEIVGMREFGHITHITLEYNVSLIAS